MDYSLLFKNFVANAGFLIGIVFLLVLALLVWEGIKNFVAKVLQNPKPWLILMILLVFCLMVAVAQTRAGEPAGW